eukprot:2788336-Pyramimonas_sp.AAC.1
MKWATDFLCIVFRYKHFVGLFSEPSAALEERTALASSVSHVEWHNSSAGRHRLAEHYTGAQQSQSSSWLMVAHERAQLLSGIRWWPHSSASFAV